MKKINIILLVCFTAFAFTSCEKAFMKPDEIDDPVNVFEYLWKRVDQLYTYFDVKGVDWDSVHTVYRPMVYEGMSDDSLFSVCAAMLNTLRDGHTNLFSDFDIMRSDTISYWMSEYNYFDENVVLQNYLTLIYHQTGSIKHNAIRDGKVAYLRYPSFSSTLTVEDLKYVTERYKDCDGLILDLRQNGGGSVSYMYRLLSIFDCHEQPLFTTQRKAGPDRNDFTAPETSYAPASSCLEEPYTKPVAVLIDRGSYSATSHFAICTQAFDNVKTFGDYSGGGLGLPNGGMLPNGWTYRFSCSRSIALDGGNYENGVPPDVRVLLDPASVAQGKDNIIETAADWIQSTGGSPIAKR
jgi:hypothetical protein